MVLGTDLCRAKKEMMAAFVLGVQLLVSAQLEIVKTSSLYTRVHDVCVDAGGKDTCPWECACVQTRAVAECDC